MSNNQFYLEASAEANAGRSKQKGKMPSSKRKTFDGKTTKEKEESKKKPDIYEAMKGAGFGLAQPKIVTNNVRSYRF